MVKPRVIDITSENQGSLAQVYKEVFAGHPWHEDLICANAKRSGADPLKCMVQYSFKNCSKYDLNKSTQLIENDCRNDYIVRLDKKNRSGIVLLPTAGLENCLGCGQKLSLLQFYPDFVDHRELIGEAVNEPGFIGYMLTQESSPIGFSWGYSIPNFRTASVNFPKINELLIEKGILPKETFYGAESGVIDSCQGMGMGSVVVALRAKGASQKGYKYFINRTINPAMHAIINKVFSGIKADMLFKDPERDSTWFKWDFSNYDSTQTEKILERVEYG